MQHKLETTTTEEKDMVYDEIMPHAFSLITDVFGNYVIQKFFEHSSAAQRRELANQLTGHVLTLSLQMYGCRVIQKAIEVVDLDQQTKMVVELDGHVIHCVRDQNENHVIQKCIECIPQAAIQFIVSSFYDHVVMLSTHPYGCRVIQRVLEHCDDPKTLQIMMDDIMQSVCMLAQDQYGNFVVEEAEDWYKRLYPTTEQNMTMLTLKQHVLEHGKPHERSAIIKKLAVQIVQMSQEKFASNVVEKCLAFGGPAEMRCFVEKCLADASTRLLAKELWKDPFLRIDGDDDASEMGIIFRPPSLTNGFSSDLQHLIEAENGWDCNDISIHGINLFDTHEDDTVANVDIIIQGRGKEDGGIFLRLRISDKDGNIRI